MKSGFLLYRGIKCAYVQRFDNNLRFCFCHTDDEDYVLSFVVEPDNLATTIRITNV